MSQPFALRSRAKLAPTEKTVNAQNFTYPITGHLRGNTRPVPESESQATEISL